MDVCSMSAETLAREIREKRVSAESAARAYLERIARYDGVLNAVGEIAADALECARELDERGARDDQPVFGLPILVKDNIDVRGLRTTAGSLALKDNVAAADAPVIANLRKRGAVILGKTHMTEFANYTTAKMPGGYSSQGGLVQNAYGAQFTPSGSSSGSAVAVSAGFCAAALGTDTSFSVVGCATDNGVTGFKPPVGELNGAGVVPIAHTLDSVGALTHTLSDALMLYSAMRDEPFYAVSPMPLSRVRLAVNVFQKDMVSEAQLARYDALFLSLRAQGATIREIAQQYCPHQRDIMRCEFRPDLEAYLANSAAKHKTLSEIIQAYRADPERMMKYGITYLEDAQNEREAAPDGETYINALRERVRAREAILSELANFDACVMTGPTNIMHFTGLPSLALKLGMGNDGAPRGIILYGADEHRLYAAALAIEQYCPPVTPPRLD